MRTLPNDRRGLLALLLTLASAPLAAQAPAAAAPRAGQVAAAAPAAALPAGDVYRREVFRYQAGGRPDPFRPLLSGDDMGVRVQDLRHGPGGFSRLAARLREVDEFFMQFFVLRLQRRGNLDLHLFPPIGLRLPGLNRPRNRSGQCRERGRTGDCLEGIATVEMFHE